MRTSVIGLGLIGLLTLAPLGCSNAAGPEREMSGKATFDRHCARCHGLDGRPTPIAPTARDLTNRKYVDELGDRRIEMAIMGGRPPGMPAFGGQFSAIEMDLLVSYVRSLSNPTLGPQRMRPEGQGAAANDESP
ncbi:c-type cytochrome [Nannocystaceae bacterium ST9]